MMKKDIRNHPYHFEQALQRQNGLHHQQTTTAPIHHTNISLFNETTKQQQLPQQYQPPFKAKNSTYFTWLVFMSAKWVPFDGINQSKLEQSQQLGGTFVDIEDSNFPKVKRVRVFPKSNYLSYLGVKYRLSRVMQPDAWSDSHDIISTSATTTTPPPPTTTTTTTRSYLQQQQHTMMTRILPPPPSPPQPQSQSQLSSHTTTSASSTTTKTTKLNDWRSAPHQSSQTLISHVLS